MKEHVEELREWLQGRRPGWDIRPAVRALIEQKAAPVGEREAFEAWWKAGLVTDTTKDLALEAFQAGAAYQRQVHAEHEGPDYSDGPEFEGWAERSGQQPSAGVVMPERKDESKYCGIGLVAARHWNACLDEFARLNGKEVGRG